MENLITENIYIPKGGTLEIGTHLECDHHNPKLWGRSGLCVIEDQWINNIYKSEVQGFPELYIIAYKTVKGYFYDNGDRIPEKLQEYVYSTSPLLTKEQIFNEYAFKIVEK